MHHLRRYLTGFMLLALLAGCTDTVISQPITAQPRKISGSLNVAPFTYQPTPSLQEKQIAYGPDSIVLLLDKPVAQYMQESARVAFSASGMKVKPKATCTLKGNVTRFALENSVVHLTSAITTTYTLSKATNGSVWSKTIDTVQRTANPFPGRPVLLSRAAAANLNSLLGDAEFRAAYAKSCIIKKTSTGTSNDDADEPSEDQPLNSLTETDRPAKRH